MAVLTYCSRYRKTKYVTRVDLKRHSSAHGYLRQQKTQSGVEMKKLEEGDPEYYWVGYKDIIGSFEHEIVVSQNIGSWQGDTLLVLRDGMKIYIALRLG